MNEVYTLADIDARKKRLIYEHQFEQQIKHDRLCVAALPEVFFDGEAIQQSLGAPSLSFRRRPESSSL